MNKQCKLLFQTQATKDTKHVKKKNNPEWSLIKCQLLEIVFSKFLRNTSTYLITKGNFISFHYRLDFVRKIAQQIRQREYNDGFSFYWH